MMVDHASAHDEHPGAGHVSRLPGTILPPPPPPSASSMHLPSSASAGTKRKMSIENVSFPHSAAEIDPQLVGPGSGMNTDSPDAPSHKRRGSVATAQNMAHLSLHDRRNSLDSRPSAATAGGPAPSGNPWPSWTNDKRDSNVPFPGPGSYPPGFSVDAPGAHGSRLPPGPAGVPNIAWPGAGALPPGQPLMQPEGDAHNLSGSAPRPFDPAAPPTMPPVTFAPDRRMSVSGSMPSPTVTAASGSGRTLRSRSRPESRASEATEGMQPIPNPGDGEESGSSTGPGKSSATPYSRSPELRVSHKLAERKRRKEMKDLFDELRDQLPADRGMKASKWEILSKAVEFITQMKRTHQDMSREIEMLRHELDAARQGLPFVPGGPPPGHPGAPPYPGAPHILGYGPPPGMHPGPPVPPPQQSTSRPGSAHATMPPGMSASGGEGLEDGKSV